MRWLKLILNSICIWKNWGYSKSTVQHQHYSELRGKVREHLVKKFLLNCKEPHCEFILVWSQSQKNHIQIEKSRGLRGGQNFHNYFTTQKWSQKFLLNRRPPEVSFIEDDDNWWFFKISFVILSWNCHSKINWRLHQCVFNDRVIMKYQNLSLSLTFLTIFH